MICEAYYALKHQDVSREVEMSLTLLGYVKDFQRWRFGF